MVRPDPMRRLSTASESQIQLERGSGRVREWKDVGLRASPQACGGLP